MMGLKAIIFDFNGVIINDEAIHQQLIDDLLLGENLRPSGKEYQQICLGKSDSFLFTGYTCTKGANSL